jgi:EAL domain-containing protein (putative c-di-GMP-specific phosphodiesterase class I)
VDRSFITSIHQRPRNQSILGAIESLGRALSMSVIVEGVETFEELAYLQAATRIRLGQGYYFSKPVHFDEVPEGAYSPSPARQPQRAREPVANRQMRNRAS